MIVPVKKELGLALKGKNQKNVVEDLEAWNEKVVLEMKTAIGTHRGHGVLWLHSWKRKRCQFLRKRKNTKVFTQSVI